jgi:hypothetical protein
VAEKNKNQNRLTCRFSKIQKTLVENSVLVLLELQFHTDYYSINCFFLCLGSVTVDKSSDSRKFTFNDVVLKTPNGRCIFIHEQNLQLPYITNSVY